jgi:hypothetical protein
MYYVRYPLSFRQVEDILHERGTLIRVRLCLITPPPHLELVNYISYLFILEFFSPHVRPHKFWFFLILCSAPVRAGRGWKRRWLWFKNYRLGRSSVWFPHALLWPQSVPQRLIFLSATLSETSRPIPRSYLWVNAHMYIGFPFNFP